MIKRIGRSLTLKWMVFSILLATIPLAIAGFSIIWIFVGLAIVVILSLIITKKFSLLISNLSKGMEEVSKGNLDVYVQPTSKDEVGHLTMSFNQMIQYLRKSERALKEAEEKYRRIFEDSKDMVYITSVDGKIVQVNQAGVDLFGYGSKEEMMQVYARDTFFNPEDRRRFWNEIRKEWFVKDFEVKLKRKDGTPINVFITANARKDDSGNITSYEGIIINISDRKRMEEELLQRTEELQALYELSGLINQSLDLNEVLSIALEKVVGLTGYEMGGIYLANDEEQTLELNHQFRHSVSFAGKAKVLKYGEGVSGRAAELKRPVIFSITDHPSSQIASALKEEGAQTVLGFPFLAKGKVVGTISLVSRSHRELSQREVNLLESIGNQIGITLENAKLFSDVVKAKKEWETTFDSVTDLITIRYKDYRILRVNRAASKRYGMKPREMIGRKCYEIFHHKQVPCEGCYISETLQTKKPVSGERKSEYLNGIFQYYTFPIYNESGEVMAVVDLSREITVEKQQEMEKEVVNNINKILASSLDVRQVMKAIHSELKKIIHSERTTLALLDEGKEGFRYFALEKDYEAKDLVSGVVYSRKGTHFERVVETGLPVTVSNTTVSDCWVDQKLANEGIFASLVFPLEYKGKIIGTMNFGNKQPDYFCENHIRFLYSVAPGLAISIQNALLFEEIKKRLDELTILYEITRISASSSDLDQMLKEVMSNLNNILNFDALGIMLIDENTKKLLPHPSFTGHSIRDIDKLALCLGKGITGWVAENGESLLVNDVRKDPRYICGNENIRSEMCVPLKIGQKVIGIVDAQSRILNSFSEDDLRLLSIVGGQLATFIENLRLYGEIKESEEKYRTVVEGAMDGVGVIGDDYQFRYVNDKLAETLGYSREESVGMDFRNFLDEKSKKLVDDRYVRSQRGEEVPPHFEFNVLRKEGEIRNVEISSTVMKDSRGNTNTIAFIKDITEKRKMEEQLVQTEKLRALGEMASGVAHDFNNALAAILGNTQILLYTVKEEEIKKVLKIIEKVTKDSAQTVRRLQDFTRKKVHQELYKVDINGIVKDSIEITKPKWKDDVQSRGIRIEMVPLLEEVLSVKGNASELREVITNLIFNAIEAMPKGGKIEIRTFQRRKKIFIQISDNGIGMTEETKKKIFEPFFTTKPFTNTGLGLSVSYGIVNRLGGEIKVDSKIEYGTTFTIGLPGASEGKEEQIVPPVIKTKGEARILVVDDEENVRSVLSRILSQVNYQVTVAENGEEGLRLFKEKEFDIVLTDLGMPGISGWEVCRMVKKINPQTPVGMITGWGSELSQSKIKEYHLDFLIPKPFEFNQVVKVVAETIESKGKLLLS